MSDLLVAPLAPRAFESKQGRLSGQASHLLQGAETQLRLARRPDEVFERFSHTHFAALRLAGAVLAVAETAKRIARGQTTWDRLARCAPELAHWTIAFEKSAKIRAAFESGNFAAIDRVEADRWLEIVEEFCGDVLAWFGLDPLLDFDTQYTFAA